MFLYNKCFLATACGRSVVASLVVEVKVPQYKTCGSDATLACHYSLEGDTLYSLKWYKGDSQFYQYIPANKEPKTFFEIPDIEIDVSTYLDM